MPIFLYVLIAVISLIIGIIIGSIKSSQKAFQCGLDANKDVQQLLVTIICANLEANSVPREVVLKSVKSAIEMWGETIKHAVKESFE